MTKYFSKNYPNLKRWF